MADLLMNPRTYDPADLDPEAQRLLRATIDWFEARGKTELKRSFHEREWYSDFLDFMASEQAFATLLTPGAQGGRWDTARICAFGEVLAFYGLRLLVHLAGHHPGARPDLAERERGREGPGDRDPSPGRRVRVRAVGEGARRGHLPHRHGAHPHRRRRRAASGPAAASTTSATATWPGWCRSSAGARTSRAPTATSSSPSTASTRRTTWSRTWSPARCSSASSGSRTTRSPPTTCCTPGRPPSTPR